MLFLLVHALKPAAGSLRSGQSACSTRTGCQPCTKVSHGSVCPARRCAPVVLGVFLLNIRVFGQMFRADRVTSGVVNVHRVLAGLCSLAGICNPVFGELQACWWQV